MRKGIFRFDFHGSFEFLKGCPDLALFFKDDTQKAVRFRSFSIEGDRSETTFFQKLRVIAWYIEKDGIETNCETGSASHRSIIST